MQMSSYMYVAFRGALSSTLVFHQRQISFAEIHFVAISAMTQFWGFFLTCEMSSDCNPSCNLCRLII